MEFRNYQKTALDYKNHTRQSLNLWAYWWAQPFFSKLSLKIVLCNGALRHTAEAWWGTNWPRLAEWWGTNRPRLAEWVPGLLSLVPFPQFRSRTLYIEVRHRLIWRLTLRNFKMADKVSNQIQQSDPIFLSLNLVNLFSHFYQLI